MRSHGDNLMRSIARVGELDKGLAEELTADYLGFLRSLYDIFDEWSLRLEH